MGAGRMEPADVLARTKYRFRHDGRETSTCGSNGGDGGSALLALISIIYGDGGAHCRYRPDHPRPNLEHMILHALLIGASVLGFLAAAKLWRAVWERLRAPENEIGLCACS